MSIDNWSNGMKCLNNLQVLMLVCDVGSVSILSKYKYAVYGTVLLKTKNNILIRISKNMYKLLKLYKRKTVLQRMWILYI